LFLILLLTVAAYGQEAPLFQTGVNLVKIDVQVTRGQDTITNLEQADFVVLDQGVPQQVAHFGRESEPLWVLLLLDVSGSMGRFVKAMAQASRDALTTLNANDHVGIMLFSRDSAVHAAFTSDFDAIARELGSAVHYRGLGTATRINSAIIAGADHIRESLAAEQGRRAIVILTDNGGMNYQVPNEMVLRALSDANTVLNAIAIGNAKPPPPARRGVPVNPDFIPSDIFLLADDTGGEVVRAKKVGTAFRQLIERVRTRYSLHYYSPGGEPGSFRTVTVKLTPQAERGNRNARIRARSGYYVP